MKKLLILLCLCSINSFAQNGFFLQPEIGAGVANSHVAEPQFSGWYVRQFPPQNLLSFNGQLGLGYQVNNKLSITSGIYFLRSGYKYHYLGGDLVWVDTREKVFDYHVGVPLIVSYQFNLGNHFFITPGAGGALSYNAGVTTIITEGGQTSTNRYTGAAFESDYNRTSFWAIAQAHFGYKLNRQTSIIAGPEAQYMLTSMVKYTTDNSYQKNYVYSFNAGLIWHFKDMPAPKAITE